MKSDEGRQPRFSDYFSLFGGPIDRVGPRTLAMDDQDDVLKKKED
jgi:hypothetical protein